MAVWASVVIGLAGFVVLVLLILAIPLSMEFLLDSSAERKVRLRMIWLFGLFSQDILPRKQKRRKKKRKSRMDIRTTWQVLQIPGFIKQAKRLIKRVLRQIRIETLKVNLTIGFDDPADGGMIFAVIGALKPFIRLPKGYEFEVQSSFSDRVYVEGNVRCVLYVLPVKLILPILLWIFSLPTLKMAGILISNAWKKRSNKRLVTDAITAT